MKANLAASLALAGVILAQLTVPGTYNLGPPTTPGTRVPESNPGTAVQMPQAPAPSGPSPAATFSSPPTASNSGPAYSFGAAPAPTGAPGR
ncbi:MAG TPA: hypothetical protein VFQ90_13160 [Stellaceae bacterium]|jgi:hypothetical protein|nr:hypothetical protein [Stellaceae bacterium]